jgi:hypothetical protein
MKRYLYAIAFVLGALALGQALSPLLSKNFSLLSAAQAKGPEHGKEPGV